MESSKLPASRDTPVAAKTREALVAAALLAATLGALFGYGWLAHKGDLFSAETSDLVVSHYFWKAYARSTLAGGRFPFWNPYSFCGIPFAANPETALFYPPTWVFFGLSLPSSFNLSFIFHYGLAGFFTWQLARRLGCDFAPALVAGLVFMLSGASLPRILSGHFSNICTLAWLPLVFLHAEQIIRGAGSRGVAFGALAFGLMILAGHVQYAYFGSVWISLYALLRLLAFRAASAPTSGRSSSPRRSILVTALLLASMALLGLGLAAVQLKPTLEMSHEMGRSHPDPLFSGTNSLPPICLITMVMPGFFGKSATLRWWGPANGVEVLAYGGLIPLLLLLYVGQELISRHFRTPAAEDPARPTLEQVAVARALALSALAVLIIAFGRHTILFGYLYELFPALKLFRGWAKFLGPFTLAVALLCGFGLQWLLEECARIPRQVASKVVLAWAIVTAVAVGATLWMTAADGASALRLFAWIRSDSDSGAYRDFMRLTAFLPAALTNLHHEVQRCVLVVSAGCGLLVSVIYLPRFRTLLVWCVVVFVGLDLCTATAHLLRKMDSEPLREPRALASSGDAHRVEARVYFATYQIQNVAMVSRVRSPFGPEANFPWGLCKLASAANGRDFGDLVFPTSFFGTDPAQSKVAQILGIRYIYRDDVLEPVGAYVPRARLYARAQKLNSVREVWDAIRDARWNPQTDLLLSRDDGDAAPFSDRVAAPEGDAADGSARDSSATGSLAPSRVPAEPAPAPELNTALIVTDLPDRVTVRTRAPAPAWLYLSDTLAAGWVATVDGAPTPIWRAFCAFRAVPVPAGEHQVTFEYTAPGFAAGLALSLVSAVILALIYLQPGQAIVAHQPAASPKPRRSKR